MVIYSGLSHLWKMQGQLATYERCVSDLRDAYQLGELPFPSFDWTGWSSSLDKTQAELLSDLAKCIPLLALVSKTEGLPDFLGRGVNQIGEACFAALIENEPAKFAELFRAYFVGALSVWQQLHGDFSDRPIGEAPVAMIEPIVDLLTLSGYAYVWGVVPFHVDLL